MDNLIQENIDLSPLTTFGVAARARLFAEYSSLRELKRLTRLPEYIDNEILHIGGGSNLLFVSDFDGLVIHSAIKGITEYRKNDDTVFVIAGAGERWTDLVDYCIANGLAGLENLTGIPGEVGASAVQNVGAYGVEAKDCIHAVECYDTHTNEVVTLRRDDCRFGYRDSIFKNEARGRYFVLRVSYRLHPSTEASNLEYGPLRSLAERLGHTPTIAEVSREIVKLRTEKLPDPDVTGSGGSFFKNPVVSRHYYEKVVKSFMPDAPCYELPDDQVKIPAGWLIEHSGLKGTRIGGAEIWPAQCLVIANTGHATANDVLRLSDLVRRRVHNAAGVYLQPEVNFIDTRIRVRVLGSGTSKGVPEIGCDCRVCTSADPHDKRLRASVLVRTQGLNILIDPSPDFRQQALSAGIDRIDAVLVTHTHFDHVGGFDDLRPLIHHGKMNVYLQPNVAADLRRRLDYCFREHVYPGVPQFELHELDGMPFHIGPVTIEPVEVMHGQLHIFGYRIGKFAYITDAKTISEEERDKLRGLDLLIINALRYKDHFAHFTVEEALEVIADVKPRRALLTHMNHDIGLHNEVCRALPENISLAYDGEELTVD